MSENKKPCPFCASTDLRIEEWLMREHIEKAVYCNNCGAQGPNALSVGDAVEMWNLRRRKFPSSHNVDSDPEMLHRAWDDEVLPEFRWQDLVA